MTWSVTTPPVDEPVTLDEAKLHLRVDAADEDTLITALIQASRQHVENVCERALMPQVWTESLPGFPASMYAVPFLHMTTLSQQAIALRGGLVRAVDSVKYIDIDGAEQTLDPATYITDLTTQPATITPVAPLQWPVTRAQPGAVKVQYQVGYADAAAVPATLKVCILLLVGENYTNRSISVDGRLAQNIAIDQLMTPYKRIMP